MCRGMPFTSLDTPILAGRDQSLPHSTTSASDEIAEMDTGGSFVGQSTPRTHSRLMGLSSRTRSHNTLLHLDATGGSSQDSSPVAETCPNGLGQSPDTYVLLKRVSHVKAPVTTLRPRMPAILKSFSSLQRRLLWLVLAGLLLGGTMHGFVLWHGLAWQRAATAHGKPGAASLSVPGLEKGVAGRVVSMAPPDRTSEQKLGMPGDSDRLPNQPVWDASKWNFTPRADPATDQWPNTVAICSIMKSEHPDDVVQWLKYHAWLGVDKVFLRENAAQVPPTLSQRLAPFIESGFLDLGALPGAKHPLQNRWYNRCSKPDMAGMHSWVAFIDLDEFMVVLDKGVAAKLPDLKEVLRSFKGNAGLSMQWVMFGSSGHVKRPTPGGPLAHYHQCTGKLSFQMKCMANMYHASHHMMVGNTVHDCTYRVEGDDLQQPPVTLTDGTPLKFWGNTHMTNPNNDTALGDSRTYRGHLDKDTYDPHITEGYRIVLFHYVTRSLEDYTSRKIRLPSGIYTHNYVSEGKNHHEDLKDARVMTAFEHKNGFDGKSPVCSSALTAFYAGQCCS